MRFAVAVLTVVVACGPSATEIRRAQTATYAASPERVLQAAMEAANELYGVGAVDAEHLTFVTKSFFMASRMRHRGWGAEWARGGWIISVHTTESGHSLVIITPHAQRSLASCRSGCAPSWIDVPADDVALAPELEDGRGKLAVAIHERVRGWEVKQP